MGINCYYHMKQCNIINANMTECLMSSPSMGPKYNLARAKLYFWTYCRRTKALECTISHTTFFAVSASEGKIRINTIYL